MKNKKDNETKVLFLPIFMSIGISVGMAIGAAINNIPVCMSVGLADRNADTHKNGQK